ncbi:MAG: hypothetical protein ABJL67_23630 [Sulfitobacter sp.]
MTMGGSTIRVRHVVTSTVPTSAYSVQAADALRTAKRKIAGIDKEIDKVLDLILASGNTTAFKRYETKIGELEHDKALLTETLTKQTHPKGSFEGKLEPALMFLANPFKIWATGSVHLRRLVLKLAFADRIRYCRNEGARTTELAFPFRALEGFSKGDLRCGAGEGTRTPTP